MKFFKRIGLFKNSTGTCTFNPETKEGFSYDWWKVSGMKNGKLVFNTYFYGNTTSKHQNSIISLLGYPEDVLRIEAPKGLDDHKKIIEHYLYVNKKLRSDIRKPRTHKAKNIERATLIKMNQTKLSEVRKWENK